MKIALKTKLKTANGQATVTNIARKGRGHTITVKFRGADATSMSLGSLAKLAGQPLEA